MDINLNIKNLKDDADVEVLPSKKGALTLKVNGNFAHSAYDPLKEAEKIAHDKLKDKSVVFVLGLGLGYHVKRLSGLGSFKIVVIETSTSVLKTAFAHDEKLLKSPNILLYLGDISGLADFLSRNLREEECLSPEIVKLSGLVNLFKEEYLKASDIINLFIKRKVQSRMTTVGFGKKWITNTFKNISLLKDALTFAPNKLKMPVFIVASGPSLSNSIPYVKLMAKKGVLVCVSHSLNILLKNNILPDFVIAIDGGHALNKHFLYLDKSKLEKICLVTCLSANHNVVKSWPGKKIFVSIDMPFEKDVLKNSHFLPVAGTVSATAYYFAYALSGKAPYFVGLDLAFTNSMYHHRGSIAEEEIFYKSTKFKTPDTRLRKTISSFKTLFVQSACGGYVKTNMAMASYRDYLDACFKADHAFMFGKEGAYFENASHVDFLSLNSMKDVVKEIPYIELETDKKGAFFKLDKLKAPSGFKDLKISPEETYFYFIRYLKEDKIPSYLIHKFNKLRTLAVKSIST